jgi:hypothetical protein
LARNAVFRTVCNGIPALCAGAYDGILNILTHMDIFSGLVGNDPYIAAYPLSETFGSFRRTLGAGEKRMPRYNVNFELSVEDMELIEAALRQAKSELAEKLVAPADEQPEQVDAIDSSVRQIHDLLGRLHNQKVFYRPRSQPYISG